MTDYNRRRRRTIRKRRAVEIAARTQAQGRLGASGRYDEVPDAERYSGGLPFEITEFEPPASRVPDAPASAKPLSNVAGRGEPPAEEPPVQTNSSSARALPQTEEETHHAAGEAEIGRAHV